MSVEAVRRTTWSRMATLLVCVAALTSLMLARPQSVDPEPQSQSVDPSLPGANDWLCRPSKQHPEPVVLVHGLFATPAMNWPYMAEKLHAKGYCVFALTWGTANGKYPLPGMATIEESAKDLKLFVERVLLATGARKVDLLGHSAGGLMPRQYLRFEGGAARVDDFVALASPNHGTEFHSPFHDLPEWVSNAICPSCLQFDPGSKVITRLNNDPEDEDGDEVKKGVSYTTISTKFDEYILPYTSAELRGASSQVTNITVQDTCPDSTINHLELAFDAVPLQWAVNAMDRPGPADPGFRPDC
jgi:triacylglycerol esterase/lipase EstA (alpha/beta hydrolase family)